MAVSTKSGAIQHHLEFITNSRLSRLLSTAS
jgi:hypothetical protein